MTLTVFWKVETMSSPYAYMDFWATHVVTMVRTMRGDK